jgi:hypothetical protein
LKLRINNLEEVAVRQHADGHTPSFLTHRRGTPEHPALVSVQARDGLLDRRVETKPDVSGVRRAAVALVERQCHVPELKHDWALCRKGMTCWGRTSLLARLDAE